MSHNKKKEVAKSSVRGVDIEFDNEKLASIRGIPGNNGICEYIKNVWEESKYIKPLEITRTFANDETIMEARRVKSVEIKPFQRFIHFLVMKNVVPRFGKKGTTSYMDLTYMDHLTARRLVNSLSGDDEAHELCDFKKRSWVALWRLDDHGTGEHRRRDDVIDAPAEKEEEEEEAQNADFDWEVVVDEAADQGESGSGEKFYDAKDEIQESAAVVEEVPAVASQASAQQKETEAPGVDPLGPSGHIPESVMSKLQADFERERANRIQADLEKA
ncbi:hypothetical protein Dimus_013972 [Dionaea muscipula]